MASSTSWQSNPSSITSGQQSTGFGSLTGATPSYYSAEYGGIAQTPDPTVTAYQAIAGNISNEGALSSLANYWNQFNQQQMINQYNAVNPYYSSSMAQAGANAYDYLQGIIPQDVINQLGQQAAERGTQTGLGAGSANVSSALLRALGLTSLDLQQAGLTDLSQIYKDTPTVSLFDTTPYQVTASDLQAAQTAANKGAAAPVPYYTAAANMSGATSGTKAGATAAGSTPTIAGGAGSIGGLGAAGFSYNPSTGEWSKTGAGGGATSETGGGNAYQNWWDPNQGESNLSTAQEDQLKSEGWTQAEINDLALNASADEISSLFSDSGSTADYTTSDYAY